MMWQRLAVRRRRCRRADIWLDIYLKNRDPFPLNVTPYLGWKDHTVPAKNEQVRGTSMLEPVVYACEPLWLLAHCCGYRRSVPPTLSLPLCASSARWTHKC
jgi:hypothetical protein